ncbi:ABC transporter permease [Ruegeria marina]|uniref:Putative ABC transport system permease protein n=1 Tax=Ruegeria marina TaxID=639004 RepID=A0A1G6LXS9_9RHOB|nr:FtsX-like permease family protein [Ruegeria marina]SDC48031.1 putative ABC transport system permease protein [Ruegeria marina]
MSLRLAARLARRELRGGVHGFRIFLVCLALGVAAIAAVGSVRSAIESGLAREAAVLLGGDAQMEFTYRYANAAERSWMTDTGAKVSELVDFRSMAVVGQGSLAERALTQVKAVDEAYPLLGEVVLDPDMSLAQALGPSGGLPGAAMEPVLADRLGLALGDRFRLGEQEFTLRATVTHFPDGLADGFALGPRTLVLGRNLAQSGLLAPGTLFTTKYRLDLPDSADLPATAQAAKQKFAESGLRWTDARNGAPGISDFTRRLGAFLVLVGLSGLAVGGIGISAAVHAHLAEKTATIATLRTLGADRRTIFLTFFLQIGALTLVGILFGLAIGGTVPLLLAPLISAQLPVPAVFTLYPEPLTEAAVYGLLTAFVFTLWPLSRLEDIRAAALFRDALGRAPFLPGWRYLIATLLALGLLVGLSAWFSGSLWLTLWTAGGVVGALVLLAMASGLVRFLARRAGPIARNRPALRWALGSIANNRNGAAQVMLSLGLGLSVLAAVGQIDGNLRNAISRNLPEIAPSYFFVDIQQDQIEGFVDRLNGNFAVQQVETAPMLRGIITRINGQSAREIAGNHWVLRGDRGITYSANLPADTTLTKGDWWPEDYDGPPLISFAAEEAEEMGLQLGDRLTVNILGRDIEARITSFREVDFSTAGMGFVMAMNPAALAGAPHSFIATVYAEEQAEAAILRDLATAYPNITAIRVKDAIDLASDVLAGLASATAFGAGASILTGFIVLVGAAATGQSTRIYEAAILRTLGASRRRILLSFLLRNALLGAAAGSIALTLGIMSGWAVSVFVFDTGFSITWLSALTIITAGIAATTAAEIAFAWRPLTVRPSGILRARE